MTSTKQQTSSTSPSAYESILRPSALSGGASTSSKDGATTSNVTSADIEPPKLTRVVEFPDKYGETRTMTLGDYERTAPVEKPEDSESEFRNSAILLRRVVNKFGQTRQLRLELQSEYLCGVFTEDAKHHRELNLEVRPIVINRPFRPLFFLLPKLEKRMKADDTTPQHKKELELLVDFIRSKEGLHATIARYDDLVRHNQITFDILWTIFPPNTEAYYHDGDEEMVCLIEVVLLQYEPYCWVFNCITSAHNGYEFGLRRTQLTIGPFYGIIKIAPENMSIMPLASLPGKYREKFITRGKQYIELQAARSKLMYYDGTITTRTRIPEDAFIMESGRSTVQTDGRIVIDAKSYREIEDNELDDSIARSVAEYFEQFNTKSDKQTEELLDNEQEVIAEDDDSSSDDSLSDLIGRYLKRKRKRPKAIVTPPPKAVQLRDEDYLICPAKLHAYLLDHKIWVSALVSQLEDVKWYPEPFSFLELDEEKKRLVKALVESFDTESPFEGFDDVVQGKGKGLIFLLHGSPGLGKTMTAETIAEQTHRPLLRVSAGDLSTDVSKLEKQLEEIFKLGWRWGAVLLIDEADVLMSARDVGNLSRSAIVATFLRMIEYYQGMLFLTTNRVKEFDPAFYNRIHVTIEFNGLSPKQRFKIWSNLLTKKLNSIKLDKSWESSDDYTVFDIPGKLEVNGRDIRNLIRTAYGFARSEKQDLAVRHVVLVMRNNLIAPNVEEIAKELLPAARRTKTLKQSVENADSSKASVLTESTVD